MKFGQLSSRRAEAASADHRRWRRGPRRWRVYVARVQRRRSRAQGSSKNNERGARRSIEIAVRHRNGK